MTAAGISESQFRQMADELFAQIEAALEQTEDIDWRLEGGVLTLEPDAGGTIIINQHTPNREIWVAARSGGFHYGWQNGAWYGTRDGAELLASLAQLLQAQGVTVDFAGK